MLEDRRQLAFSVIDTDVFSGTNWRLAADFNGTINPATLTAADLRIDGSPAAVSVNLLDADSAEFTFAPLTAGTHTLSFLADSIQDSGGVALQAFSQSLVVANAPQYTVKQNPRLQPGNAPLAGFSGGNLDRVDLLWQTIPGGAGTQDSFGVEYKAADSLGPWQTVALNTSVNTGVESRVIFSASITGLNWNTDYIYRVRHYNADVIAAQFQSGFHTRLQAGDTSSFSFAAYGDSAYLDDPLGAAAGFRQVQGRINQVNPAFSVLLGDNVYDLGTHQQADARFSAAINPEAAAWMAGHIDYLGVGNHDVATGSGLPAEQNFSVPIPVAGVTAPAAPPATERAEHNFSWDYGDVHFITFDTNSLSDPARLDGLLKWVVSDLQASTAKWKIVYGHHPLAGVPDKPESASDNYYQQVVNRLKAAGVDLLMTGHSHTYGWTYPLSGQIDGVATTEDTDDHNHFLAGVGLPQLVSGVGGRDLRTGTFTQFPFVAAGFSASTPVPSRLGFSRVDVTPTKLTISYVAADDGSVLDSFVIEKDVGVQTVAFQQGTNGYTGAVDTFLHQNTPSTAFGSAVSLKVDGDDPSPTGFDAQALLRFDNLFGSGAGQIPLNATLRSATLQLQTTNGGDSMDLHRLLIPWSSSDTWSSATFHTNGVQADGVEAFAAPDTSSGFSQVGVVSFNVLPSLRQWKANPAANFGWAMLPTGGDGVDFNSSEGTTRPKLIVTYVPNAPPVISGISDQATHRNVALTGIPFTISDPETAATALTVSATSGNPTLFPPGSITFGGSGADRTINLNPAANQTGTATITVTVDDGNGLTAQETFIVDVTLSTQYVRSFSSTATGVRFTLSEAAVIANVLNLYDFKNPAGIGVMGSADVQLVGDSGGAIQGSLIVDPGNTTFTFVSSKGTLPPDQYTLTLKSAANGFHNVAGQSLDGNEDDSPGGDFVRTFTINAPPVNAVTVSLPSFARGPQQAVHLPQASGLGIPLTVSGGANLVAMSFELRFDPGLLNVTDINLPAGTAGTKSFVLQSPGVAQIALTFTTPLVGGVQTAAYLTANVPATASSRYGERGLLDLVNLALTASGSINIPARDADAPFVNTYFGDVSNDGGYNSFDVQQVSRAAVGLDSGYQQHLLLDPRILSDFDADLTINSFDVQRISRLAVGLSVTETPPLPVPQHNPTPGLRSDVDNDGTVDPQDILWAVFLYQRSLSGDLIVTDTAPAGLYADVNGDQQFDAADILFAVTDYKSQTAAAGESSSAASLTVSKVAKPAPDEGALDALTTLLALDLATARKKR